MSESSPSAATGSAPRSALHTDSLTRGVVVLLALTIVQRGIGFLRGVLFCRWLDPEQLGQWDMAFGFLMLAAPFAVLGLPGSFGRHVETYRQQGQLAQYFRRMLRTICLLGGAAVVLVALLSQQFSRLIFGRDDYVHLVWLLAGALLTVLAYNVVLSLFTALRNYRAVSRMQLVNTLGFAAVGILLLLAWRADTASVVIAFGVACGVSAAWGLWCFRMVWRELRHQETAAAPLSGRSLWSRVLPLAFGVWTMNWLFNLLEITDRFMLVHWGNLPPTLALDLVGQYHTARILPLLFISVTDLLATMITPHLSADWEAGHREAVSRRLNLILKLMGLGSTLAAAAAIIASPLLFNLALGGRFALGLNVLPWALMAALWAGLANVTGNYFWCAEKLRVRAFTLTAAVVLNVLLNLWLVPRYGLLGAVTATTTAHFAEAALLCLLAHREGMHTDLGLWLALLAPVSLAGGPWLALLVVALLGLGLTRHLRCFNTQELAQLGESAAQAWQRIVLRMRPSQGI